MRHLALLPALLLLSCIGPDLRTSAEPRCGDIASFRTWALARGTGERGALEAWNPPSPVSPAARVAVQDIAREYVARCGASEAAELTRQLVAFPTVGSEAPAATGKAFADMAAFLKEWSAGAGLDFSVSGANDAWEVSLGEGGRELAFVGHADVVPAGPSDDPRAGAHSRNRALPPGWTHPPFQADLVGDRLYGRGAADDKGPLASALVVMRTLAALGLRPHARVSTLIGTGEESDWGPMTRYAKGLPKPGYVISIDASFPVVTAESGFVAFHLVAQPQSGRAIRCAEVSDARAGEYLTQVPGLATARLRAGSQETPAQLLERIRALASSESPGAGGSQGIDVQKDGNDVLVIAKGVATHSSEPEEGQNALWLLARVLKRVGVCDGGAGTLVKLVEDRFDGDHFGNRLGLSYSDRVQGPLVFAPTLLRVENGVARLSVNARRPAGMTNEVFQQRLDAVVQDLRRAYGPSLDEARADRFVGDPHLADIQGPLVPTLLDIYRRETGDAKALPITIRGGTYARLFPGAVSFGPALPHQPYLAHASDEYIEVSALGRMSRMLLEATLRLDALNPRPGLWR